MVTISGLNCAKECKWNFSNTTPVFASINFFWYEFKLISKDCLLSNREVSGRFFCCTKQLSNLIKVQSIDPITGEKFLQYCYGIMEPCLIPTLLCNFKPKSKVVTGRYRGWISRISRRTTTPCKCLCISSSPQVQILHMLLFINNAFFILGCNVA